MCECGSDAVIEIVCVPSPASPPARMVVRVRPIAAQPLVARTAAARQNVLAGTRVGRGLGGRRPSGRDPRTAPRPPVQSRCPSCSPQGATLVRAYIGPGRCSLPHPLKGLYLLARSSARGASTISTPSSAHSALPPSPLTQAALKVGPPPARWCCAARDGLGGHHLWEAAADPRQASTAAQRCSDAVVAAGRRRLVATPPRPGLPLASAWAHHHGTLPWPLGRRTAANAVPGRPCQPLPRCVSATVEGPSPRVVGSPTP